MKSALKLKDAQDRSDVLNRNLLAVNAEMEKTLQDRDVETVPVVAKSILGTSTNREAARQFDPRLRSDMQRETEMLFDFILRQNRPTEELISARYSFLNERLAKHYGTSKGKPMFDGYLVAVAGGVLDWQYLHWFANASAMPFVGAAILVYNAIFYWQMRRAQELRPGLRPGQRGSPAPPKRAWWSRSRGSTRWYSARRRWRARCSISPRRSANRSARAASLFARRSARATSRRWPNFTSTNFLYGNGG